MMFKMRIFKRSVTFMDLLRLVIFFSLYFGSVDMDSDSDLDYYRYHPSAIPNFLPVPINITVHQGELAILKCQIYNLGPKLVVWRRTTEESPLTIGEGTFTPDKSISINYVRINELETHWDLWITNVQPEHAGIYECSISATDIYTLNITLNVLDPVKYEPELSINGSEYVSVNNEIRLICNSTGAERAPEKVDWFFKGQLINQMRSRWYGRLQELNRIPFPGRSLISEIIIEKATMEDAGNYVCRQTPRLAKGLKVHILNDIKDPSQKRDKATSGQDIRGPNQKRDKANSGQDDSDALYVRAASGDDNSGVISTNFINNKITWATVVLLTLLLKFVR